MIIDCIADLHGFHPDLPEGDLLILAGDYTAAGTLTQWYDFFEWLKDQKYSSKILIAGNHDSFFESGFPKNQVEANDWKDVVDFLDIDIDFEYLCDSGTEVEGLKIWGTPWTPIFERVNPKCTSFMNTEQYLEERFNLIPDDLDILITHGPMRHMLDANRDGEACGSSALHDAIDRAKPRYHIFGHIHEQGSNEMAYRHKEHKRKQTWCINCSYVNEYYKPIFTYQRIEL